MRLRNRVKMASNSRRQDSLRLRVARKLRLRKVKDGTPVQEVQETQDEVSVRRGSGT